MTQKEYKEIYDVVGAAMEVYNTLGRGLAEPIYQEALAIEMTKRGMTYEREKELKLYYKGTILNKTYFADFYYNGIIIELKSVFELISEHRAQLFNYMRITKSNRGILFNYGEKGLHTERYLYIPETDDFELIN
ncbi:MAG: GxxExxY protein, partial [Prevotella sp.]|nr:GxxExxY protein [Prevotella sp.]